MPYEGLRAVGVALLVGLLVFVAFFALASSPAGRKHLAAADGTPSAHYNTTVTCGVFGPDPGAAPNPDPNFTARIAAIWYQLCVNSTFVALLDEWGNFALAYPDSGNNVSYPTALNLTPGSSGNESDPMVPEWRLSWWAICGNLSIVPAGSYCSHFADWIGNITTESFTGPILLEVPPGCCGSPPPPGARTNGSATGDPFELFLPTVLTTGALVGGLLSLAAWKRRA